MSQLLFAVVLIATEQLFPACSRFHNVRLSHYTSYRLLVFLAKQAAIDILRGKKSPLSLAVSIKL
jgi:hypothetical protein